MKNRLVILVLLIALCTASKSAMAEYLSPGEVVAIGGGSLLLYGLGLRANGFDSSKISLINDPFPGEESIQRFLGGRYYKGKSNFLDSRLGSIVTPATGAVLLTAMDAAWPAENNGKDFSQDLFLYVSGLLATRGLTDLAKAAVARPRPYMKIAFGENENYSEKGFSYDYNSFFSGHASSSFFVATFLNKHTRWIMRRELNDNDYRKWRWMPPTIFYAWSSFVGWSRIHNWKHYLSDVAVGAAAGWLIGELFYSFNGKKEKDADNSFSGHTIFRISLTF